MNYIILAKNVMLSGWDQIAGSVCPSRQISLSIGPWKGSSNKWKKGLYYDNE